MARQVGHQPVGGQDLSQDVGQRECGEARAAGFVARRAGFEVDHQPIAGLGFERRDDVKEPEDHVAALLETMGLLIGEGGASVDVQRRFFQSHMGPWMRTFFLDLQKARSARFYRAVGQFGEQFIEFETKYLTMLA